MKIYLSADLEGILGVVTPAQVSNSGQDYERARRLMTREVNWVIEAVFDAGAERVVVNDAHGTMDNILLEELDERAELISGDPKPLTMMQGIDASFDAVFFIGYHSRTATAASVLDHTYSTKLISVKINGQPLGEAGINGRLAGYYGVPVVFISGDDVLVRQAEEELGKVTAIAVKAAINRSVSLQYPRRMVKTELQKGVKTALENYTSYPVLKTSGVLSLEMEFVFDSMAELTLLIPGVQKEGARRVCYTTEDYLELYRVFHAMRLIASTV